MSSNISFTKLFSTITDSTIWDEPPEICKVWITMLAMADKDGYVGASLPGLANRARVPVDVVETALEKFMSPDPYSRTKDHEGRRIAEADRGWVLLNHPRFRERLTEEKERERKREWARKNRGPKNKSSDTEEETPESGVDATVDGVDATFATVDEPPLRRRLPSVSASASEDQKEGEQVQVVPERVPKPTESPLSDREVSQLEVEFIPRAFVERVVQDWVTEPGDPHDLRFPNRWVTHAMKVVRGNWRDTRRRREIQAALETDNGDAIIWEGS